MEFLLLLILILFVCVGMSLFIGLSLDEFFVFFALTIIFLGTTAWVNDSDSKENQSSLVVSFSLDD